MSAVHKKNTKRRTIRVVISIVIISSALTAGVLILKNKVTEKYGENSDAKIQTATASLGSISTTVSGSGNMEDEDVEAVEILSIVEIEEIIVEIGDRIEEGDLIAKVEMSSVVSSLSYLQDKLDALDEQLKDASDDSANSSPKMAVTGRVKEIYAEEGDDVATVMYEKGALAVISLDGYLAADIETIKLSVGDTVTVTDSGGKKYEGSVSSVDNEKTTVLVTDDGTIVGDNVSVTDSVGNYVGDGELYIHEPLTITAYTGTVSDVFISENTKVSAGKKLFFLSDTEYSGNYNSLLAERKELEEQLQNLLVIYKEGAIYSPMAGIISANEDESSATSTNAYAMQNTTNLQENSNEDKDNLQMQVVLSISPGKTMSLSVNVDESSILALAVGQEATISADSYSDEDFPVQ
ncbi:MAG: hypothetical protein GX834_04740 [Clostridiaceae bacterium]|nr:hypothetical protein [Clostridiaceae bacterium]